MVERGLVFVCLALCVNLGSANLAPFITKCKWDDKSCLLKSTQDAIPIFAAGIPECNVATMDPLHFDKMDASSSNLKLQMTDLVITGLKDCSIINVVKNIKKKTIRLVLQCDVGMNTNYEMDGKIVIIPIVGKGKCTATIKKLVIDIKVDYDEKVKNGKNYWAVKSWKHTFEVKDKCNIKFDGLFADNEFLRKTTNEFIENNGNEIINEVGPPIVQVTTARIVENIKNFFAAVPIEDLSLD